MNEMTLLDLFSMGGIFMWPLLLFSIAAITLAVERVIFISKNNLRLGDITQKTLALVKNRDFDAARTYLEDESRRKMGARILLSLIKNHKFSEHRLEKEAETEAALCINSLESGFDFLSAIGSLAPLTGFLGTVSGMIGAFKSIAEATEVNAQIVANGIYEALITTVFGLIIAIVAMVASSLFSHIVDRFASETETSCSVLISEIVSSNEN